MPPTYETEPPPGLRGTGSLEFAGDAETPENPLNSVLLDMSSIFAPYTVRENGKLVKKRVVMTGEALLAMARNDQTQLYYRRGPKGTVQLVPWKPRNAGRHKAAKIGGPQFAVDRVERLQALATLQHYMKGSNLAGASYEPVYGAWSAQDNAMLENIVSYLQATQAYRPRKQYVPPRGPVTKAQRQAGETASVQKEVLDFGNWLKEATQRQRLDALDRRRIAMQTYGGGGQVVTLTGRTATDSALDAVFKEMIGRDATTVEKTRFFAAFRQDEAAAEMTAARARQSDVASGAMASLDPATRALLEDETRFEQYKVDPIIRVNGQLMHASDAPPSEWSSISARYGINYDAINAYYRKNPKLSPAAGMGGGGGVTTVEPPNAQAAAMQAAKASPEYLPYQVGRAGQQFMRMLSGEFGMPGVQSG